MNKNQRTLICTSVLFFGHKDEDAFFEWIKKIDWIENYYGSGRDLYLELSGCDMPDENLQDIIALFHRYNVDMKQLKKCLTDSNKTWFYDNKKAFWHKKVFGEAE